MAVITDKFSSLGTLTITLSNLANSGSVGRVSTFVDNTTNGYQSAMVYIRLTVGSTASTANSPFYVYLPRSDNSTTVVDDNVGTTDAAATFTNANLLGVINCTGTAIATQYFGVFDTSALGPLGPAWGIGVVNNCGGSLHTTAGSHVVTYVGVTRNVA